MKGDAESDARGARHAASDPDLAALVEARPNLPEATKAGIMAMIFPALESR